MIRGTDFILNPDKLEEQFQLVEVSEWIDYNTKEKLGFYYTVLFPKLKFEKIKVGGRGTYLCPNCQRLNIKENERGSSTD